MFDVLDVLVPLCLSVSIAPDFNMLLCPMVFFWFIVLFNTLTALCCVRFERVERTPRRPRLLPRRWPAPGRGVSRSVVHTHDPECPVTTQ